ASAAARSALTLACSSRTSPAESAFVPSAALPARAPSRTARPVALRAARARLRQPKRGESFAGGAIAETPVVELSQPFIVQLSIGVRARAPQGEVTRRRRHEPL